MSETIERYLPWMFWRDKTHRRWRLPYITRGAIGDVGGHWKVLGVECSWNREEHFGYANHWAVSFFRLVSFHHQDTKSGSLKAVGKHGWSVRFARPRLIFELRGTNTYR